MTYGSGCSEMGCSCSQFVPMDEYSTCAACGHTPESHNGGGGGERSSNSWSAPPSDTAWSVQEKPQEAPHSQEVPMFDTPGYYQPQQQQPMQPQPGYYQPDAGMQQPVYAQEPQYSPNVQASGDNVGFVPALIIALLYVGWMFLPFIMWLPTAVLMLISHDKDTSRKQVYYSHCMIMFIFHGALWIVWLLIFFVIIPCLFFVDLTIYTIQLIATLGLLFFWFPAIFTGFGTILLFGWSFIMFISVPIFTAVMALWTLVAQPNKSEAILSTDKCC